LADNSTGARGAFSVSAVIPLFNKQDAIESTLRSVLAQTRAPDELIVVDDGSTDASLAIAEGVLASSAGAIPWRVISQANAGEGSARNRGAGESRCRYIAFLDADDVWLPGHLAELERLAAIFPSATVISTRNARQNGSGVLVPAPSALGSEFFGPVERPIHAYRCGCGILNSSCVCIRRDAWERSGGFDVGAAGADVLLWLKLGLTETFAHSGRPLSVWRDEYSAVASRKTAIPRQLHHFLGTAEGLRHLDNADLVRFLASNLVMQVAVYTLLGNRKIVAEFRRLAVALPPLARVQCWAATLVPPSVYRGIAWWRKYRRERQRTGSILTAPGRD
jgi:glycosyltransferase involved in cell wall biosynthesis